MIFRTVLASTMTLLLSGALLAAESMGQDAVEQLLSGNTMNARNLWKNKNEFTSFFADDGSVLKLTTKGKIKEGTWYVSEDGEHCVDWGKGERCNAVEDLGNGSYQKVEDGKPRIKFRVSEGNSADLKL